MITEVNVPHAHAYRRMDGTKSRLLITEETNGWEERLLGTRDQLPGASCIFFSEDGGASWTEFYLLGFDGNRSGKFYALVMSPLHGIPRLITGVAGGLEYAARPYELITDEETKFDRVVRLGPNDTLRAGDSDVYERLRRS